MAIFLSLSLDRLNNYARQSSGWMMMVFGFDRAEFARLALVLKFENKCRPLSEVKRDTDRKYGVCFVLFTSRWMSVTIYSFTVKKKYKYSTLIDQFGQIVTNSIIIDTLWVCDSRANQDLDCLIYDFEENFLLFKEQLVIEYIYFVLWLVTVTACSVGENGCFVNKVKHHFWFIAFCVQNEFYR